MSLYIHISCFSLLKGVIFIPLNAIKLAAITNLAEKKILLFYLKVTLQYFQIMALFKSMKTLAVT